MTNHAPRHALRVALQEQMLYRPDDPFTLKSGKKSPHYLDCQPLLLSGDHCRRVVRLLLGLIESTQDSIDFVAGVAVGACPLVTAYSVMYDTPGVYVRPAAKDHGTGAKVEVASEIKSSVHSRELYGVLFEDVLTTGASAQAAVAALAENGLGVSAIFALVDRREELGPLSCAQWSANIVVPVHSLFKFEELIGA